MESRLPLCVGILLLVSLAIVSPIPQAVNNPPVAIAGPDQVSRVGEDVSFDGSASYDPDGEVQFAPDAILTTPSTPFSSRGTEEWGPSVGVDSQGVIHVAWTAERGNESSVAYVSIRNNTATAPRMIDGPESGHVSWTSLVVDASDRVHVSWTEVRPSEALTLRPFYARSDDGGTSFATPRQVYIPAWQESGMRSRIAVDPTGRVHVTWTASLPYETRLMHTAANGSGFDPPDVLYSTDRLAGLNDFRADATGRLHIAWAQLNPTTGNDILYFRLEPDRSLTGPIPISDHTGYNNELDATISPLDDGTVYATWEDERKSPGAFRLFFSELAPAATLFGASREIVPWDSQRARLASVEDGAVHVCFDGDPYPAVYSPRAYYMTSPDRGSTWMEPVQIGDELGTRQIKATCMVDEDGAVHAAWRDFRTWNVSKSDVAYSHSVRNRLSYRWDFGDGSPYAFEPVTSHAYSRPDHFIATLRVTDPFGASAEDELYVNVTAANRAPHADAGGPHSITEGSAITLNASLSYDPDGDALQFRWDFDGDGTWDTPFSADATATHAWGDDFAGYAVVEVTDGTDSTTASASVIVANVAPLVGPLEVRATGYARVVLRVAGEKYHDVSAVLYRDGTAIGNATVVRVPGNPDAQSATLGNVSTSGGTYSVTVTYTPLDDPVNGRPWGATPAWIILDQGTARTSLHHLFNARHPDTWVWSVDDLGAYLEPTGVTFEVPVGDPGSDDLTLTWDFGDGTTETQVFLNDAAIGPDPFPSPDANPRSIVASLTHAYAAPGTYMVTLTVVDDDGGTVVVTLSVTAG